LGPSAGTHRRLTILGERDGSTVRIVDYAPLAGPPFEAERDRISSASAHGRRRSDSGRLDQPCPLSRSVVTIWWRRHPMTTPPSMSARFTARHGARDIEPTMFLDARAVWRSAERSGRARFEAGRPHGVVVDDANR